MIKIIATPPTTLKMSPIIVCTKSLGEVRIFPTAVSQLYSIELPAPLLYRVGEREREVKRSLNAADAVIANKTSIARSKFGGLLVVSADSSANGAICLSGYLVATYICIS